MSFRQTGVDETMRSFLQQQGESPVTGNEAVPPLQKRPSKPKLPPFTRGENPTCPSPGPPSPSAVRSAGSAQIHAMESFQYGGSTQGKNAAEAAAFTRGQTVVGGGGRLSPLTDTGAATLSHSVSGASGQQRPRSNSQGSPNEYPARPHPLTRRASQPSSFGTSNSMSIETGVLSPRRLNLPSTTSSSPSPPPSSPQGRYRPGHVSSTRTTQPGTLASRGSASSAEGDATHLPSPTSSGTTFHYGALKSASQHSPGMAAAAPSSPATAVASGSTFASPTASRLPAGYRHSTSTDGGSKRAMEVRSPQFHRAYSETAVKKVTPRDSPDAELELEEQLAKLGESLNRLKSFSRSNSINKSRSELPKDYQSAGKPQTTDAANAMRSLDASQSRSAAPRPRRLTRTASDGDSLRYDFDLRPQNSPSQSPLALDESEEDTFDELPRDGKRPRPPPSARTRTQRPDQDADTSGSKAKATAGKPKGVQRSITFSHGNESAMRRQVYGSSVDDHHAIAALPPDLLLKRILFDKSGSTSPATVKS